MPTAHTDPTDLRIPDAEGIAIMETGAAAMREHEAPGAILGYYRDASGVPLSAKYAKWFKEHEFFAWRDIKLVGGTGDNTVWDITTESEQLKKLISDGAIVGVCSDWGRAFRAILTLHSMGYNPVWLKSQDEVTRPIWQEVLMFLIGWIDPQWTGLLGKKLGAKAKQNAENYMQDPTAQYERRNVRH